VYGGESVSRAPVVHCAKIDQLQDI
jgi:hypothetical protein